MDRRTFTGAAASALLAACSRPRLSTSASEIEEVSLAELSEGLARGRWTSRRLAELYLERIEAYDQRGPKLGSVIEKNPDALAVAEQMDRERQAGRVRSALHGVPVMLKDNIDTAGRMMTTAGSLALEGWHAPADAFVAARLRAAGALILGKTNLSEWANFRSTRSISGWSGRGGQTRNPYAPNRNTSGSSSGSGAAVAASLCAAAIGTETDGSIVSPSSVNGLVGVKPTVGLVSRSGIIPISHSQDTAGPMTRTVRDAALLLNAITGVDAADAATATQVGRAAPDYTKFLDAAGLKGARLGISRKFFESNAPLDRALSQAVDALRQAGAVIVDPADLPTHGKFGKAEYEVLLYEFKAGLNAYLSRQPAGRPARSLAELITFNEKNRELEMPYFGQEILIQSEAKGPLTEKAYLDARAGCVQLTRAEGIDALLAQHKLDAIVSLTNGPGWLIDTVNGDYDTGSCSSPAAVAGYPHITVPSGFYMGLPVGLSFYGTAWSEPTLFRLAYAFEQFTKARRKPRLELA